MCGDDTHAALPAFGALEANAAARGMKSTDMKLLDAGCGSGNYLNAVRPSIGSGTGLEASHGLASVCHVPTTCAPRLNPTVL